MSTNETPEQSQKTEEPTYKRLQDARRKGQVAVSREVNTWLIFFTAAIILTVLAPSMLTKIKNILASIISDSYLYDVSSFSVLNQLTLSTSLSILSILMVPFGLLFLVSILGGLAQNGMVFAPEAIVPKLEKISPVKGFKRLFSTRQLVEFTKGILKITLVGVIGLLIIWNEMSNIQVLPILPALSILGSLSTIMVKVFVSILAVLLVIAIADLFFVRYQNYQQLRMTKQEVKDEFKNTEGDPHIKARLRQIRQERARQRIMQALPKADVVITNPTHYAVALEYKPESMNAPVLIAKGLDSLALRIKYKAQELEIPVVENPPLSRLLYDSVNIDDPIQPEHYKAVAEVISYVWKLKNKLHNLPDNMSPHT